jgi:signal transduction histidine kinase
VVHSPLQTEVTVSTSRDGTLCVADEGLGIAMEDRERIFDRFWRGRSTSSSGAGLGLPIVKEIMKAHGGSVTVEDRHAGGAIFTLGFLRANDRPAKS